MANGWNIGKNYAPGSYQSPNRRLAQMLMQGQMGQPRQQRRGNTGQAVDFLQSGLGAYLMSRDAGQQQAATKAFTTGGIGGNLEGARAALEGMSSNPYAQNRLQNLLMQQIGQSQKEKQRLRELESTKELYKFQQQEKVFPPVKSVPGVHEPFSPEVQEQRIAGQQAKRTSWGPAPGRPGMMQSSTGELKPMPQTAEQASQTKLNLETAQAQAEAKRGFPQAQQKAQETMANIEALMGHPGLQGMIGAPDTISGLFYKATGTPLAGTKEADFNARLNQIGGQQFLQAFESLKGGGAISEVEGKKATVALSRLTETGQSEESYRQAGAELIAILKSGLDRAGIAAGQPAMGMGQPQLTPNVAAMLPSGAGGQPAMGMGQAAMPQPAMGAEQPMVMPNGLQVPLGVRGPEVGSMGGSDLMSMYNPPSPLAVGAVPPGAVPQAQLPPSGGVQISSDAEFDSLPSGTEFIGPDGKQRRKP